MTNTHILHEIQSAEKKQGTGISGWVLLGVSLLAFAGAGFLKWDFQFVVLIAIVIFIHELGHLIGMKLFKYKNLKMMFLPLIGGVASGVPKEQNSFKIAMIALLGPTVGFISCYVAVGAWLFLRFDPLIQYAYLSVIINAFNLLPLMPLDGGHFLNETLFSRYPKVELIFKVIAIVGLGILAYKLQAWIFALIAVFILISLGGYEMEKAANELRGCKDLEGDELTDEKIGVLKAKLFELGSIYQDPEKSKVLLPVHVNKMWRRINKIYPSITGTILLTITYIVFVFMVVPFSLGFVAGAYDRVNSSKPSESSQPVEENIQKNLLRISQKVSQD